MRMQARSALTVAALLLPAMALAQETAEDAPELSTSEPSVRALEELKVAFPVPLPESLPELIELAQERSPTVRIAEAKLQEADAELRQARNEVAQRVVELWRRKQSLETTPFTPQGLKASGRFPEWSKEFADIELELRSLLGFSMGPEHEPETPRPRSERRAERPPTPRDNTEMGTALKSEVSCDFEGRETRLSELASWFYDYLGVNMAIDVEMPEPLFPSLKLVDISFADCLQAIADQAPPLCFVIRDDYILAATRERAMRINAPTIPADVPLFVEAPPEEPVQSPQPPPLPERRVERPTLPEDAIVVKMLGEPVSIDFGECATRLQDILVWLNDYTGWVFVADTEAREFGVSDFKVVDVTFGEGLLALTDAIPDLCFVFRDGYTLATTKRRAMTINAPTIPADVPLFVDTPPAKKKQEV